MCNVFSIVNLISPGSHLVVTLISCTYSYIRLKALALKRINQICVNMRI